MKLNTPFYKIVATVGGSALTGTAVWMNADHVAASEGWASPLVLAGIVVTLCAAVAPPFAERAGKNGELLKAALLWLFFGLVVLFSLSDSITRNSDYVGNKAAIVEQAADQRELAKEAYEGAQASRDAECADGRGPKCRELEAAVSEARNALSAVAPVKSVNPGSERLAAVLGVPEKLIALYVPLLLPVGLELGGFIFLAFGLAPRRRQDAVSAFANEPAKPAKPSSAPIAKLKYAAAKAAPKAGTAAYYKQRLRNEFPVIAALVDSGELSVYKATIATGLRKAPVKARDWSKPEAYGVSAKVNA